MKLIMDHAWAMPNSHTFSIKPISEFIDSEVCDEYELWIDPFANEAKRAHITNDLNPKFDTNYHMDALEFLKLFKDNSVFGVLFDPPYSPRQVKECYQNVGVAKYDTSSAFWSKLKDEIARIVKPGGKVLSFGWDSNGIGKCRGFSMYRILLVAHGGSKHDTICTAEIKTG